MGYTYGYRDNVIIPDKYNTGCRGELTSMADFFGSYYKEGSTMYITSSLQNALGTVYENIDFTSVVNLNKTNLRPMTFRNCRFNITATYAVNTGSNFLTNDIEVVFENCEFSGQTSACVQPTAKFKMINCKIHDMGSDGGKVFDNGLYENCYFYNIGMTDGAHADGIQITGTNNNFSIINCRFDVPSYTGYSSNSGIFFVLEGDSYNSVIKDCVMTGGNYTFYYGRKDIESSVAIEGNVVNNIIIGCSYRYGILNDNSNSFDHNEVKAADKLFVSSVYKENGKIKLLVTNYTNTEKVLKLVTDSGITSVTIPACPLCNDGLAYTTLSDFPFDIEIEVDGNYVVCYDTEISEENQIRYVTFVEDNSITVPKLFKQICDAIREKNGKSGLIKHTDIPQEINSIKIEGIVPEGNINITENGEFDVTTYAKATVNIDTLSDANEDIINAMGFNNNFPDKYNCGCKIPDEEMLVLDATNTNCLDVFKERYPELSSIFEYRSSTNTPYWLQLEFKDYTCNFQGEEYIIEGVDFTSFPKIAIGHRENTVSPVTIIFRNCKLPYFYSGYPVDKCTVSIKFEHCDLEHLAGGDYDFEWCFIENKNGDGVNPGSFVHGKNFYIYNYISQGSKDIHVDGIQLYGDQNNAENTIHDVSFENYRCELIPLKWSDATSAVNDPIMVQVEFSGCDDITFKHCYINGGASSVDINNGKNTDLKINDVKVNDVHVGTLRIYTVIKENYDYLFNEFSNITNLKLNNIIETGQAYCGSVWKEDGNNKDIHLSLTNHTNQDRKLIAVTEDGITELSINKCMNYSDIVEDVTTLDEFPFDVEYIVSTNGTSFIDVYDAGCNDIQTGRNLIPLKKYKFDDMVKTQNIEYPFETYTDGSVIYYDLLENQVLTPANANYKLKYLSSNVDVANVVNDYLVIKGTGDCIITVTSGNHYKKEFSVSIAEITYDVPATMFYGSDFGTCDFELSKELPYFFTAIGTTKDIAGRLLLINSPEPLTCSSSTLDRLVCVAGTKVYIYNEETKTWDLYNEYTEITTIYSLKKFTESEFMYSNYDLKNGYNTIFFKANYNYLEYKAKLMRDTIKEPSPVVP